MKNRKNSTATLIVLLLLALIYWGLKKCRNTGEMHPDRAVTTEAGDWRHHKLVYTKHARCRMECREISESEVEFVLVNGTVNVDKSRELDEEARGQCPTYALEANTADGQHVRIVFGACEKITKVITAIDLGEEHICDCR